MGTRKRLRALAAGLVMWLLMPGFLAGCGGGGGGDGPQYALAIDEPPSLTTAADEVALTGDGFLPPGSTCSGDCKGLLPPPVFGQLGAYTLGWRNEASGASGVLSLAWVCNCGGSAPYWIGRMPLVAGANSITVTMSAGGHTQSASVTITRI
jgi:hypothetical protein